MSDRSDLYGDMWNSQRRAQTDPLIEERSYDALLAGQPIPPDAPAELSALGQLLQELTRDDPVADYESSAAAAGFRRNFADRSRPVPRPHRRRLHGLTARSVAVIAAGTVGLGGVGAAYAGVLPRPAQKFAHHIIHAPAPHRRPASTNHQQPGPRGAGLAPEVGRRPSASAIAVPVGEAVAAPAHSRLLTVSIPATRSGFPARPALVYLPPAASVRGATLPVIVLLHGVPGGPKDWVRSGLAVRTATLFAQTHGGRAPILVMPDINGSVKADTECVVDRQGHSVETYLTVDVPQFLMQHYRVMHPGRGWMVGGLSEGGTCAVMLALRHPSVFGSFADFSGLTSPTVGKTVNPPATIKVLFHGSRASYNTHDPLWLLRHHRYRGMAAWFVCGANDESSLQAQAQLSALARGAGMAVTVGVGPGSHQWSLWQEAFSQTLGAWWSWYRS